MLKDTLAIVIFFLSISNADSIITKINKRYKNWSLEKENKISGKNGYKKFLVRIEIIVTGIIISKACLYKIFFFLKWYKEPKNAVIPTKNKEYEVAKK